MTARDVNLMFSGAIRTLWIMGLIWLIVRIAPCIG